MTALTRTPEWRAKRNAGLGASDAAVACGLRGSRVQLYGEKANLLPAVDLSEVEAVEWGLQLEGIIGEVYSERTGRTVTRNDTNDILYHRHYPWMLATVDFLQDHPQGESVLEVKNVGWYRKADWVETPPLAYQVQLQHQIAVVGVEIGTLCALLGGNHLVWFDIPRNEHFIQQLIYTEERFWEMVQKRTPPEPDGSEDTADAIRRLWPVETGEAMILPPAALEWDAELTNLKRAQKNIEAEIRQWESRLKLSIGDAEAGILPDGTIYTHKTQTRNMAAREAYTQSFRVLRRKEAKRDKD